PTRSSMIKRLLATLDHSNNARGGPLTMQMIHELDSRLDDATFIVSLAISGKVFARSVGTECDRYSAIVETARRIQSVYYHATGTWCTMPQAIAAAYSVPEGAPIAMAADNVGPLMDDAQCADFERKRSIHERNIQAF